MVWWTASVVALGFVHLGVVEEFLEPAYRCGQQVFFTGQLRERVQSGAQGGEHPGVVLFVLRPDDIALQSAEAGVFPVDVHTV